MLYKDDNSKPKSLRQKQHLSPDICNHTVLMYESYSGLKYVKQCLIVLLSHWLRQLPQS